MTIKIDKDYDGNILLWIHGWIIQSKVVARIRPVLMRHIDQLSNAIEAAAGKPIMETQREKAIEERRATFVLMERFDGIRPDTDELNSIMGWMWITAMQLSMEDERRLLGALQWYRDNERRIEDEQLRNDIDQLINYIEQGK